MQKQDVMYYVKIWFASDVIIFSTAILPASTLVLPGVVVIMSAFHVYSWNPFPFIHLQPEKGTPSGRDPLRREGTSAKAWLLKQVLWSIFHYLCRLQNNSSKLGMKGVTLLPEYPTSLFFCLLQLLSVIKDNNWLRSLQKRHLVLKSRMCFSKKYLYPPRYRGISGLSFSTFWKFLKKRPLYPSLNPELTDEWGLEAKIQACSVEYELHGTWRFVECFALLSCAFVECMNFLTGLYLKFTKLHDEGCFMWYSAELFAQVSRTCMVCQRRQWLPEWLHRFL